MILHSEEFWEAYEERAAVMEYCAADCYPTRRDAERAAYAATADWMEDKLPPEDQRSWFIILRKRLEKLKREASA
jgi:hypothetical protein